MPKPKLMTRTEIARWEFENARFDAWIRIPEVRDCVKAVFKRVLHEHFVELPAQVSAWENEGGAIG
jgi:hypothetical protein